MRRNASARAAWACVISVVTLSCATSSQQSPSPSASVAVQPAAPPQVAGPNQLTTAEQRAGWRLLFNGQNLQGWRGYQWGDSLPAAWRVVDGVLTKDVTARDIITKEQFDNFELSFEWKLARGGNAGVFFRATEEYDRVYWSAPEFQLLDDPNAADGRNRLTAAGAAYGLYPAPEGVVKAFDEWNTSRVIANGAHVEHWLNGQKIIEYEAWSPEWEAKVKASKFAPYANFGRAKTGFIALQGDHRGNLALRNIKIRPIK